MTILVIDPITDAGETAESCYVRIDKQSVSVTDQNVIRALNDHPTAKSYGEGSYTVDCIEIEKEEDGRYLASMPSVPGLMAYGATQESAILALFRK